MRITTGLETLKHKLCNDDNYGGIEIERIVSAIKYIELLELSNKDLGKELNRLETCITTKYK